MPKVDAGVRKYNQYKQNYNKLDNSYLIIRKKKKNAAKQAKSKLQAGRQNSNKPWEENCYRAGRRLVACYLKWQCRLTELQKQQNKHSCIALYVFVLLLLLISKLSAEV